VALGSAVIGAGASIYGSQQAAGAASDAANLQNQRYGQTRSDLSPYFQPGYNALNDAAALSRQGPTGGGPDYLGQAYSNLPLQMTQAQLEQTPGYQFDLSQGQKAVQSAAAARGLGVSGASLKGAANFATGLANKTYMDQFKLAQDRFNDYINLNIGQQGNLTNQFNRLNSIATLGANAGAQVGTQGTALANQAAQYINAAGVNTATGMNNATNALTSGANNYLAYNQYDQQTKGYDKEGGAVSSGVQKGF